MLVIKYKTKCTCCELEIKWQPEAKQRVYANGLFVVEKQEPGICIRTNVYETKNNITYILHCNFCNQENHVTVQK